MLMTMSLGISSDLGGYTPSTSPGNHLQLGLVGCSGVDKDVFCLSRDDLGV